MRQLLLCGLILLGACDAAAPNTSLVGTWTLHSIDGKALPQVVYKSPVGLCDLVVRSSSVSFDGDGSYVGVTRYGIGDTCVAEDHESGTYLVNGRTVTLSGNGQMSRSGSDLVRESAHRYVYRH